MVIEDTQPFTLHFGHDDWQDVTDRDSTPGQFGLHRVTITSAETGAWKTVDFKRRYGATWENSLDHHVTIVATAAAAAPRLRNHSGA